MAPTNSQPKTFAISYGLGGGPLHSKRLIKLMEKRGLNFTQDFSKADIVLAHSAGCFLIPSNAQPKLVIYVGMPLAQDKPFSAWRQANLAIAKSQNFRQALKGKFDNTLYMFKQPRRNFRIIKNIKGARPIIFPDVPAVFIANKEDPWPQSTALKTYMKDYDWPFISFPGSHDDIWSVPEFYVDIIDHYAGLLG